MDQQSRQEYVRAAISFLQNPKLSDSTLQDKLKFLKDKGLSQVEVDEALNLALINRHQNQSGKWNFLIVLGLFFGGYKLYQAYMESKMRLDETPLANRNKSKPYRNSNNETVFQTSQTSRNPEQISLQDIMQRMMELKEALEYQRTNFQSEIKSIKTLLLGHEKFAAPPKIPAWQLEQTDDKKEEQLVEK